jgi:hypothetical protein
MGETPHWYARNNLSVTNLAHCIRIRVARAPPPALSPFPSTSVQFLFNHSESASHFVEHIGEVRSQQ